MKHYSIYLKHYMGSTFKKVFVAQRPDRAEAEKALAEYLAQGGDYFLQEEEARPIQEGFLRRQIAKARRA